MNRTQRTIRQLLSGFLCVVIIGSQGVLSVYAADTPSTGRLAPAATSNASQPTERAKARLSGVTCEAQKFCIYTQDALKTGIASMTIIPRFYHMAINCYVQAAFMGTKRYYDMSARAGVPFSHAESGLAGEWALASFCTEEVKDGDGTVINAHVIANTKLLYAEGAVPSVGGTASGGEAISDATSALGQFNPLLGLVDVAVQTQRLVNQNTVNTGTSALHILLEQYDARMKKNPEQTAASSTFDSPERFVSDILWKEYLSYTVFLRSIRRSTSEVERAQSWADSNRFQSSGAANWSSFLRDQIESINRADSAFDARVAEATRDVADVMYGEFVRSYAEHLQYLVLRDNLRKVSVHLDSIERAMTTLSIKLRDAFVTKN